MKVSRPRPAPSPHSVFVSSLLTVKEKEIKKCEFFYYEAGPEHFSLMPTTNDYANDNQSLYGSVGVR